MIGKKIKANASFPIDEPAKIAYGFIGIVIVVFLILAVFLATSLSL